MTRALVLLSGGIDSAVSLAWAAREKFELIALSFEYHLRPFRERLAVFRLLQKYPARLIELPLPFLKEAADSKPEFATHVPEGYVSNRNMIFYSLACHFAEIENCSVIVGGHTAEDQEAFPDASAHFFDKLQTLANQALLTKEIEIAMPLAEMNKLQVLQKAIEWNVPLEATWSCYWDGDAPCGKCISCIERAQAFQEIGTTDPLLSGP